MPGKHRSALRLRAAVEDAGWRAREAAAAIEESVLWPSATAGGRLLKRGAAGGRSLVATAAASRLGKIVDRARWSVERVVAWPFTDALRDRGASAQAAMAAAVAAAALAAATGGALLGAGGPARTPPAEPAVALAVPVPSPVAESAPVERLSGVDPDFRTAGSNTRAGGRAPTSKPPPVAPAPSEPMPRTAWRFARAFLLYEVGKVRRASTALEEVATPALAGSLTEAPPRLPANVAVPKARVLNVVSRERRGRRAEASVSLLRRGAVSELRLRLRRFKRRWRVVEVRG